MTPEAGARLSITDIGCSMNLVILYNSRVDEFDPYSYVIKITLYRRLVFSV